MSGQLSTKTSEAPVAGRVSVN